MNKNVSENLKRLREESGMTQEEVAKYLWLTNASVSAYETGIRLPTYNTLVRLAKLFRVSTDNILGISQVYNMDVSKLTQKQRNTVQEIVHLYEKMNGMDEEIVEKKSTEE